MKKKTKEVGVTGIRDLRDQAFHLSLKVEAVGILLNASFGSTGESRDYGLGMLLLDFAKEISDLTSSLDVQVTKSKEGKLKQTC